MIRRSVGNQMLKVITFIADPTADSSKTNILFNFLLKGVSVSITTVVLHYCSCFAYVFVFKSQLFRTVRGKIKSY